MPDIYSKNKRSRIMASISGKDTQPELLVRKYLFSKGFRFRKNDNRYPGKPDIVLPKYRSVIFINGCFWHGHTCKKSKIPETRKIFWEDKLSQNKLRDKRNYKKLRKSNWHVFIIWECRLKSHSGYIMTMDKIITKLKNLKS
jgi:DNA mismatch endonuclease (patch repair protein)